MGLITFICLVGLVASALANLPATDGSPSGSKTGDYMDICTKGLVQIKSVNETGRIGVDTTALDSNNPNPCILKLESCPTCQVAIEPDSTLNFTFFCQTDLPVLKHQCSLGCDYLYMFDMYYVNQTVRIIRKWTDSLKPFRSQSSSVYIVLCHGYSKDYNFVLRYRTIKKSHEIHGSSLYMKTGNLLSPFFPNGYYQNFETYEYIFTSSKSSDHIYLMFDDWDLDSSSALYLKYSTNEPVQDKTYNKICVTSKEISLYIHPVWQWFLYGSSGGAKVSCISRNQGVQLILAYIWTRPANLVAVVVSPIPGPIPKNEPVFKSFEDSDKRSPVYGSSDRPVVISKSHTMKVIFNTGQPVFSNERREHMGFNAKYTFIANQYAIQKPNTGCKGNGYHLDSVGGKIEFSKDTPTIGYFDCIWVVKALPGYSGIFLRLMKKRIIDRGPFGRNQITIRSGITSAGNIVDVMHSDLGVNHYRPHTDDVGFYIHINATLSSTDSVVFAYASYKETYSSNCKHDTLMFPCNNGRCIDKSLICDGFDHCGDNTDETTGCSYDGSSGLWDRSYQYTITIGVIVPMVISVFLIMVICLLFVMVRRCRRARLREAGMNDRLQTLSEEVASRRGRRRRRRHRFFGRGEADAPPSYDEAIQNPPGWYENVAFGSSVDPTLPQPPSYTEAIGTEAASAIPSLSPGSPSSTDGSQSDVASRNDNPVSSSSSSEEGSPWGITRRQSPRSQERTDTSRLSSSESEVDETEVSSNQHSGNRNTSLTSLNTDRLSDSPNTNERIRKETKAKDSVKSETKSKYRDKISQKNGPSAHNFVIPDSNKVGSSRSMEVLPTMSLAGASSDLHVERIKRSEDHHGRTSELRNGGPQSPKNGSCPALSGNLSIFKDETDRNQTYHTSTYPAQQHSEQSRNRSADRAWHVDQAQSRTENYKDPRTKQKKTNEAVKRENCHIPENKDQSCDSQNEVMVVYDGPNMKCPDPNQSPSRMPAYLLSNDVSKRTHLNGKNQNHRSPEHNESPSYKGNGRNQDSSRKQENKYTSGNTDINSHGNTENQRKDNYKNTCGNNTYSAPGNRRLAHLPILNQTRRNTGQSRASTDSVRNRQSEVNKPTQTGRTETDKQVSRQNLTGQQRSDRHVSGEHRSDNVPSEYRNDRHVPGEHRNNRYVPSEHRNNRHVPGEHRNNRHVPGEHRNDRYVPRQEISDRSPTHRGYETYGNSGRENRTQEGPVVAMNTDQSSDGALTNRQDVNDNNGASSPDSEGYLNLYRMGGEDDDIYV